MPFYKEPSEKQIQNIRRNWARLKRLGPARFVAASGTIMFLFMVLCWIGFSYLYGTQRVLRMPFVWESTLPFIAILSFLLPACWLMITRVWIRRVGEA